MPITFGHLFPHGVPQRSMPGPLLFLISMLGISFHFDVNDSSLCLPLVLPVGEAHQGGGLAPGCV